MALPPIGSRVAAHELVEATDLSVLGAVLIQERELRLVELAEEFVPADLVERFFLRPEVDPQNAGMTIFLGRGHRGRTAVTLFCPFANLVVVGGRCALAHGGPRRGSCEAVRASLLRSTQKRSIRSSREGDR